VEEDETSNVEDMMKQQVRLGVNLDSAQFQDACEGCQTTVGKHHKTVLVYSDNNSAPVFLVKFKFRSIMQDVHTVKLELPDPYRWDTKLRDKRRDVVKNNLQTRLNDDQYLEVQIPGVANYFSARPNSTKFYLDQVTGNIFKRTFRMVEEETQGNASYQSLIDAKYKEYRHFDNLVGKATRVNNNLPYTIKYWSCSQDYLIAIESVPPIKFHFSEAENTKEHQLNCDLHESIGFPTSEGDIRFDVNPCMQKDQNFPFPQTRNALRMLKQVIIGGEALRKGTK
jgi:hypothetical protein